MIFKKIKQLLRSEFNIPEEQLEETTLIDDLGMDMVDLSLALEETFEIEEVPDLSNLETIEDLIDYIQGTLDM